MKSLSIRSILVTLALLFLLPVSSRAVFLADIDQDGDINLADAILSLQIVSGKSPAIPQMAAGTDLDKDGKIGLAETLYTLRAVAQSSLALSHRAAFTGPLSGAAVAASRAATGELLEGIKKANSSSTDLQVAGSFDLSLPGADDAEWVVVAVTGGMDIDADGNGVIDPTPTANQGTLHALARAGDWRSKQLRITPLTELAWRYVEQLIKEVPPEDVAIRLADIARNLIETDIDGNGSVDWYDIMTFDPANPVHRANLATSYDWLTTVDAEGYSIAGTLRADDEAQMLARMDTTYSYLMTRFPVPDSRYHSVKVTLAVFGPGGAASSAPHALAVNSTLAQPVYEDSLYALHNESTLVTFAATPGADARILSWTGCDTVSANLSQCTVPLNRSQSVIVNFGRITAQLSGTVHDLSRTNNIVGVDTVAVSIPADMADMIAEMATAAVDDFVVGPNGGGFLRRIAAISQISSTYYKLDTVEAALDEVITQGTGHLFKQMENGDLDGYVPPPLAGGSATVSAKAFTGLPGVSLQPASDPSSRIFTISLGTSAEDNSLIQAKSSSVITDVVLYDDGQGGTVSVSGEINLEMSHDFGVNFDWNGLRDFKFITTQDVTENIQLTVSKELKNFSLVNKKIGAFQFSPIVFTIGIVPVWITPTVEIFIFVGGEIDVQVTAGISFTARVEGGQIYNRDTGFSFHKRTTFDYSPLVPTVGVSASLKGGLESRPSLKVYSFTGPAIPLQGYLKLEASASHEIVGTCVDVLGEMLGGFEADFIWDMSGASKIGKMLHLDQLEERTKTKIFSIEKLIKQWPVYNNCPEYTKGSHLDIEGDGIFSTIAQGDSTGLLKTLTLTNIGDEILTWNTSGIPSELSVSPSSGILSPGVQTSVQMSLATTNLPAGHYLKKIYFSNAASVGQNLPDEQFGNTYKTIDVTVNETISDAPDITSAVSTEVGRAILAWDFSASSAQPFVGFQIFATKTPENPYSYQHIHTSGIFDRSAVLSGLTPGAGYSFVLRAFNNYGAFGAWSDIASVTIAGTPPAVVPQPLNDTGITWGGSYPSGNNTTCTSNIAGAQDCSQGRDAGQNYDGDGHAGFSYTKLDASGNSLAAGASNWSCVRDNVTGLVWEVKTDDGGIHDKDNTYRWGGKTALGSGYGTYYTDWNSLVDGSNNAGFCGYSDWRVPTVEELAGLADLGRNNPAIDTAYFPNTQSSNFWSASPVSGSSNGAWIVGFYNGDAVNYDARNYIMFVRLVRSGQ